MDGTSSYPYFQKSISPTISLKFRTRFSRSVYRRSHPKGRSWQIITRTPCRTNSFDLPDPDIFRSILTTSNFSQEAIAAREICVFNRRLGALCALRETTKEYKPIRCKRFAELNRFLYLGFLREKLLILFVNWKIRQP